MPGPLEGVGAILELGVLVLVVASVGGRVLSRVLPQSSEEERLVLGSAVGMALLSILSMACLFGRVPLRAAVPAALLVGAMVARRELSSRARDSLRWLMSIPKLPTWGLILRCLLIGYVLLGVLGCLAPETGWDAGVYHFAMPRLWVDEGRMFVRPDIPLGAMPAAAEVLYAVGFALDGETLASLMNLTFYLIGFGLARLWADRLGGAQAGTIAGFAYLSSTTYVLRMGGGDVEVSQAVYLSILIYALWRRLEGGAAAWRAVAGIAFGMMIGIKYTSAWALIPIGGGWLLAGRARGKLRSTLEDGFFIVLGGALAAPWYVRNALNLGNPLYPIFSVSTVHGFAADFTTLCRSLIEGFRFDAFVIFLLAAYGAARSKPLPWVAVSLVLFLAFLLVHAVASKLSLINIVRFWSPAFLPVISLGSPAIVRGDGRPRWIRFAAPVILTLCLSMTLGLHGIRNALKARVAFGFQSREDYLEGRINSFWAIRAAEAQVPPGQKILLVEQRGYYCRAPYVAASDIQAYIRFEDISTPAQFRGLLDREGIAWIVYNHSEGARTWRFRELLGRVSATLAEAGVRPIATRTDCTLYKVDHGS